MMELKAVFREKWKMVKFTQYLDDVPYKGEVETSMLSKTFCLSSSAAAANYLWRRGDFVKVEPGRWMKTDKNL
jgi:hypothetical protein